MLELLKSLVFAVIMVPVVMAIILGLIYGLGEVFNIFSGIGQKDQSDRIIDSPNARSVGRLYFCLPTRFLSLQFLKILLSLPIFSLCNL